METDNNQLGFQHLVDKDAIREKLLVYFRGIDRLDRDLLETVFWPTCTIACEPDYTGFVAGFLDWGLFLLSSMEETMHMVGNMLIGLSGKDQRSIMTVGVPYFDIFEKRAGGWRIADRVMVIGWYRTKEESSEALPGSGADEKAKTVSTRKPDDFIYQSWFQIL